MDHGHKALLGHEAVLSKYLALFADQTVLSAMLQLVSATQTANLLAMACPAQELPTVANQSEYRTHTSSTSLTGEEIQ